VIAGVKGNRGPVRPKSGKFPGQEERGSDKVAVGLSLQVWERMTKYWL